MVSHRQILRMLDAGQSSRLVQRILMNGRCVSQCAITMLCHPAIAPPTAIGLALQRAGELHFGSLTLMGELAARLAMFQNADGTFGNLRCASDGLRLAATAVAVRGWLSWLDAKPRSVNSDCGHDILEGVRCGLESLREAFHLPRFVEENAAAWAIVLWQLGDRAELKQVVPADDLLDRLEAASNSEMLDELFAYARAVAA
jgi:hypothetical protein